MFTLSNIICSIDVSSKFCSVALRGYTYEQITVHISCNYLLLGARKKDLEMRAKTLHAFEVKKHVDSLKYKL